MGDRRTLKEQPWYVRYNVYGVIVALIIFVFVVVGFTYPYEPFVFYGWRNVPPTVCPLEQFNSTYVSKVKAGPYHIGQLQGTASMLTSNDEVVNTWEFDPIELEPYPKTESDSVAIRSAPVAPGVYKFGLNGKVTGKMFWVVPTYQLIDEEAKQTVTVLPPHNKKCTFKNLEGG